MTPRGATRRVLEAALPLAVLAACGAPSATSDAPSPGTPLVLDASAMPMPEVITDGPERVARLRSELDNLSTLAPLTDGELDELDAIEAGLEAFEVGRAFATLDELEARHEALEDAVFARVR